MRTAGVYTLLSLFNLLGFAVGVMLMPPTVVTQFGAGFVANGVGSPWVYLALPASAAVLSLGLWAAVAVQKKHVRLTCSLLVGAGIVLATLGWIFFAVASSGVGMGEKAEFPAWLTAVLPCSLLVAWLGSTMPRFKPNFALGVRTRAALKSETVWGKTHRLLGMLLFSVGLFSALLSVALACIPSAHGLQFLSAVILVLGTAVSIAVACVYSGAVYRREKEETVNP